MSSICERTNESRKATRIKCVFRVTQFHFYHFLHDEQRRLIREEERGKLNEEKMEVTHSILERENIIDYFSLKTMKCIISDKKMHDREKGALHPRSMISSSDLLVNICSCISAMKVNSELGRNYICMIEIKFTYI